MTLEELTKAKEDKTSVWVVVRGRIHEGVVAWTRTQGEKTVAFIRGGAAFLSNLYEGDAIFPTRLDAVLSLEESLGKELREVGATLWRVTDWIKNLRAPWEPNGENRFRKKTTLGTFGVWLNEDCDWWEVDCPGRMPLEDGFATRELAQAYIDSLLDPTEEKGRGLGEESRGDQTDPLPTETLPGFLKETPWTPQEDGSYKKELPDGSARVWLSEDKTRWVRVDLPRVSPLEAEALGQDGIDHLKEHKEGEGVGGGVTL